VLIGGEEVEGTKKNLVDNFFIFSPPVKTVLNDVGFQ